ncbi:hypothetical protein [Flavobacterium sp. N1736]|uniref:hypothetical protein n=1 Tax=Flavobacterium sp. N1736 TaxID=2986823 RepID=UPI0022255F7C|nr:hypothetical protein [Flavobacterium sp. N1736]
METNSDHSEDLKSKDVAYRTKITTPDGTKPIERIENGDTVLAFSSKLESGKIKLTASNQTVSYSAGVEGQRSLMVYFDLRNFDDSRIDLICSLDQPLLLINGKYARAGKLGKGQELVNKEGNPVTINSASMGYYQGGIHAIVTNAPTNKLPDGHLLLANGIIIGDFIMQSHFDQLDNAIKEI